MHIPDGFLDLKTCVTTAGVSIGYLSYTAKKVKAGLSQKQIPLMGVMGAFIFAAQMVNFPVAGGTSGHLMGGTLAAAVFGPWVASIIITCILVIQWLFMNDGGFTVLGANILNMAIIGPWVGYAVYLLFSKLWEQRGWLIGAFVGAWLSVFVAAGAAGMELAVSGTADYKVVLSAILFWHAIIGIGEGVITSLVLVYLKNNDWPLEKHIVAGGEING